MGRLTMGGGYLLFQILPSLMNMLLLRYLTFRWGFNRAGQPGTLGHM